MEDADTDNWRAVDNGVRPATWSDILGDPTSSPFLTATGRDVSRRMVGDLTASFGQTWLPSVMGTFDKPYRVRNVFQTAPSLALPPAAAVDSFITIVRWWASVAVNRTTTGMSTVRRDLQANLTDQRFLHTVTMLRLGAIARSAGMDVSLEPIPGGSRPHCTGYRVGGRQARQGSDCRAER